LVEEELLIHWKSIVVFLKMVCSPRSPNYS